jgi:hypothetical protein
MRDSLILPASARVEPAVFAARARSEPSSVRCQALISVLGVDRGPLTRKIDNSQSTAGPLGRGSTCKSLLDFDTEEAVTSAADGVAPCTSNSALCQTCFKHEQSLVEVFAHDFSQASDDFTVRTVFGALVEEMSAFSCCCFGRLECGRTCEQVEDAVVVDFVHANDDSEFGGLVDIEVGALDNGELRHARNSRHVALRGHGGRRTGVRNERDILWWLRLSLTCRHRALKETEEGLWLWLWHTGMALVALCGAGDTRSGGNMVEIGIQRLF